MATAVGKKERASTRSADAQVLHDVASAELSDLCGVINAAHGRMVEVVADVIDSDAWASAGIHTPRHWLTWQTALSDQSASAVVWLAKRRSELAATVRSLREGRISLASAGLIARYVPAEYEACALEYASVMTVAQLRRCVSQYQFDNERPTPTPAPAAGSSSEADQAGASGDDLGETDPHGGAAGDADATGSGAPDPEASSSCSGGEDSEAAGGDEPGGGTTEGWRWPWSKPIEERREVSQGVDDDGNGWLSAHLPPDEAAIVQAALRARRDDLYAAACKGLPADAPRPRVTLADALLSMAESVLAGGEATMPGTDRYQVHAHLTAAPGGGNNLQLHLGAVLPHHLRRLYTCDCQVRPVLEVEGVPCNIGRNQRIVTRRLRRLIEHRDGGCAVPGCERRTGLQIHHIVHWEDGGLTETANLLTLCRSHHRAHHLGHLWIEGDADWPRHSEEGVRFRDRWGTPMAPSATPTAQPAGEPVRAAAARLDLLPVEFEHPLGERLDAGMVVFNPNRPGAASPPAPPPPPASSPSWPPEPPTPSLVRSPVSPSADYEGPPTGRTASSGPPVSETTDSPSHDAAVPATDATPPMSPDERERHEVLCFRSEVLEAWRRESVVRQAYIDCGLAERDPDDPTWWELHRNCQTIEPHLDRLVRQAAEALGAAAV